MMGNVIRMLSRTFNRTVYVQLKENEICLRVAGNGDEVNIRPQTPFSGERLLVADPDGARAAIGRALREALPPGLAPVLVMHPLEKLSGGLSLLEGRALAEIGYALGARKVFVVTGDPLTDAEVDAAAAGRDSGDQERAAVH
jgi:hypothetical protein